MKICQVCRHLCEDDVCVNCGSKELINATSDEMCFVIKCQTSFGKMLSGALEQENISCILYPCGQGKRTSFTAPIDECIIYIQYAYYNKAMSFVEIFNNDNDDEKLRKNLLDNYQNWHIAKEKTAKKIRRKFKLAKDADVLSFVRIQVEKSPSIVDRGEMTTLSVVTGNNVIVQNGITVSTEKGNIWFSSVKYEVLF